MKPTARIDFNLNGVFYEKGDEVKVQDKSELVRLNEKGFINPLSPKEIQNFGKKTIDLKKEASNVRENTRQYTEN